MIQKRVVNVGLIGCGTVGMGVVKILEKNLPLLESKVGSQFRLTWICSRKPKKLPLKALHQPRLTSDWRVVVNDPSVDIIIELIGGYEPARSIILEALKNRKHV